MNERRGGVEEVPARLHTHNIKRVGPRLRPTTTKAACSSWSVRGEPGRRNSFWPFILISKDKFLFSRSFFFNVYI
jgi:hypothetical protein